MGGLLAVCVVTAVAVFLRRPSGTVAVITLDGTVVEQVDLSQVAEGYEHRWTGNSGVTNVVEIAPGRVRVREADCPDQICVHQGWIETGTVPIVCLPNRLIIEIRDGNAPEADAVAN